MMYITIAIFNFVILNTFIILIIKHADRKSETIQFFDVKYQIDTPPAPNIKHKMSIPLTGIGPILQLFLKKLCLINL